MIIRKYVRIVELFGNNAGNEYELKRFERLKEAKVVIDFVPPTQTYSTPPNVRTVLVIEGVEYDNPEPPKEAHDE